MKQQFKWRKAKKFLGISFLFLSPLLLSLPFLLLIFPHSIFLLSLSLHMSPVSLHEALCWLLLLSCHVLIIPSSSPHDSSLNNNLSVIGIYEKKKMTVKNDQWSFRLGFQSSKGLVLELIKIPSLDAKGQIRVLITNEISWILSS